MGLVPLNALVVADDADVGDARGEDMRTPP